MKRGFEKKLKEAINLTDKVCSRLDSMEYCYSNREDICEIIDDMRDIVLSDKEEYISILDRLKEIDSVENLGECMDIINRKIEKLKETLRKLS